jgi:hypothetical protein
MANLEIIKRYEVSVIIREIVPVEGSVEPDCVFVGGTVGGVNLHLLEFAAHRDKERWLDEILKAAMANARPRLIQSLVLHMRSALNGK